MAEQHVIQKQKQAREKPLSFRLASNGGWRKVPPNLIFWDVS